MQTATPPDSDPEAELIHRGADDDHDVEELSEDTSHTRIQRHREIVRTSNGSATKGKQIVRRQRRPQRTPQTPESVQNAPLLIYKPSAAATRLRGELVQMMARTQRIGIWFELVPSRIGHSEAVDCAAKAIIKAADLSSRRTNVTEDSCLSSYSRAIVSLRDGMSKGTDGDEMLLAVALMVTFERMFSWTSAPLRSHMHGIMAILMSQTKSYTKPPTELTRALVYTFWPVAFIGPCVMGTPSPLESARWLDSEPVAFAREKIATPWDSVAKIRKIGNQLFIRLPRLIMLVKGLQTNYKADDLETAVVLAKELLALEDVKAESELLHHVNVQKSTSTSLSLSDITPYVMHFDTMSEFEAAMHYWSSRIFLHRLCWRMHGLYPTKYKEHKLPSKQDLETQIARMSANILMSTHWGASKGEAGQSCCIMDLVAVWGVLNDFDVFASRGLSPAKARAFLREYGQEIMGIAPGPTAWQESGDRLQAAAELFAGGVSSGILAFTFKKG